MTYYTFFFVWDGALDLSLGDTVELEIVRKMDYDQDWYETHLIRQMAGVKPPPDLGVNVSDSAGISDRLG